MKAVRIVKNTKKPEAFQYEIALKKKLDELGISYNDPAIAEAVIVLGGDGTILQLAGCELPLLGINLGNVGYMSELEKDELCCLNALVDDSYEIEHRMMLDVYIDDGVTETFFCSALNEAVMSKGAVSHMIDIEFSVCDRVVSVYSADGLIAATPTGSSAYSMASGGPIVDPKLELICITPVSSHSLLNSRSLIFPPLAELSMKFLPTRGKKAYLSVDGRKSIAIDNSVTVKIKKSSKTTKLIRLNGHCFCDTLYRKLSK